MKKQINFEVGEESYVFRMTDESGVEVASFTIGRPTLEFNASSFYESFFKDYKEGVEIEFQEVDSGWNKEATYVFGVVKEITDKACKKLTPKEEEEGAGES